MKRTYRQYIVRWGQLGLEPQNSISLNFAAAADPQLPGWVQELTPRSNLCNSYKYPPVLRLLHHSSTISLTNKFPPSKVSQKSFRNSKKFKMATLLNLQIKGNKFHFNHYIPILLIQRNTVRNKSFALVFHNKINNNLPFQRKYFFYH